MLGVVHDMPPPLTDSGRGCGGAGIRQLFHSWQVQPVPLVARAAWFDDYGRG